MATASEFRFRAVPTTDYRVVVSPEGLVVQTLPTAPSQKPPGKELTVAFASVVEVALKELRGQRLVSEALTFRTKTGAGAHFGVSIGQFNGDLGQIFDYRQAASAAMRALAEVNPDAQVRVGQTRSAKLLYAAIFSLVAALLGVVGMWLSGGPGVSGYAAFAIVFGAFMFAVLGRIRFWHKPALITARNAAVYLAQRANGAI